MDQNKATPAVWFQRNMGIGMPPNATKIPGCFAERPRNLSDHAPADWVLPFPAAFGRATAVPNCYTGWAC